MRVEVFWAEMVPIVGKWDCTLKLTTAWVTHCESIANDNLAFICNDVNYFLGVEENVCYKGPQSHLPKCTYICHNNVKSLPDCK